MPKKNDYSALSTSAVDHLRSLPPGTELSQGELALAIDAPEGLQMSKVLAASIREGAIAVRAVTPKKHAYRLGGTAAPRVASVFDIARGADSKPAPPQGRRKRVARAAPAKKPARKPGRKPRAAPQSVAVVTTTSGWAPPPIEPAPDKPPLSVALFNTGELVIETAGEQRLRLSRTQVRELFAYLQRISLTQELTQ